MRKTYTYRIYLTSGESLGLYDTQALLPAWKDARPILKVVHSQVRQNVCRRVHLAFEAFFRRVREGTEQVGYPRFKGKGRYNSITSPQYGNGVRIDGERLILSKIGAVQMVYHSDTLGAKPKGLTDLLALAWGDTMIMQDPTC